MNKEYVIVRFNAAAGAAKDGTYSIWADYGEITWGSPIYEVIGYRPTYSDAWRAVKEMKSEEAA